MIHDAFLRDNRLSATAHGVGIFVAEHATGAPLGHILAFFRDSALRIAQALDELEALDYVRRTGDPTTKDVWAIYYTANPTTLGGVIA